MSAQPTEATARYSDNALAVTGTSRNSTQPTREQWANVFGPSAYDMKEDENRNRKRGRVHIPDIFLGPSQFLTDRVDGLIVDATQSPFTTVILPYMYMEYPDKKIEWNVWSFDQGLASRVPYEAAARTLTQRKQSFSGYTVRQGLAITMEHNFMMSEEGMQNFKNQVLQVVQSIQNTNDLDVHMALINAPSYLRTVRERYYLDDYLQKALRDYIDSFGFVQKNMNAMDILIEEAKAMIKTWGGDEPDFLLCSSKLCFQLTMGQEKTSYLTQGPDGKKLLRDGPMLQKYRGLGIVKSKAFSMDEGLMPRDLMRRRVRVAEHYVVSKNAGSNLAQNWVQLYNESSDDFQQKSFQALWEACQDSQDENQVCECIQIETEQTQTKNSVQGFLLIRPNIEHYMLGMIVGRGGLDYLGATLWGQTEMSVFDDGQHGVWGMTYKYHERAIVFNERNMHRMWDIAYDGYVGGKELDLLQWHNQPDVDTFKADMMDLTREYSGKSLLAVPLWHADHYLPSPVILGDYTDMESNATMLATADLFLNDVRQFKQSIHNKINSSNSGPDLLKTITKVAKALDIENNYEQIHDASTATVRGESTRNLLMYAGTVSHGCTADHGNCPTQSKNGNGHHGPDYTGVAAVRNGKSLASTTAPMLQTMSMTKQIQP